MIYCTRHTTTGSRCGGYNNTEISREDRRKPVKSSGVVDILELVDRIDQQENMASGARSGYGRDNGGELLNQAGRVIRYLQSS
jgi:hypothetical protein